MSNRHFFGIRLAACALAFAFVFALAPPAQAAVFLTGTVTNNGAPAPGVTVTASGNNVVLTTKTDAQGRYSFPDVTLGTYTVTASATGLHAVEQVDVGQTGATLSLALVPLATIGNVAVSSAPSVQGSGADTTLNSTFLTRSPTSDSFPETLIQLPGTARGANGVVHMNGDHGVIDYVVDGVPLPQAINREIGSEIDPNDVDFVDLLDGAYPAQYGLRFGSVLNISTKAGTGPPGFYGDVEAGSYAELNQSLGYHAPLPNGGGFDIGFSNSRTDRGLDPPDFDSPHNDSSDASQFARFTFANGNNDFTDLSVIHSFRTYQVPNDIDYGEPGSTDDVETQDDTFVNLQFRHALGQTGSWSFGPAFKISRIRDFGDEAGDFTYGEYLNADVPPPFGNAGTPLGTTTGCADSWVPGQTLPNANYMTAPAPTCAFSLTDDKTSLDAILQSDYDQRFGKHEVKAGVGYDLTRVIKNYAVTLQPGNFLPAYLAEYPSPLATINANGSVTVVDDNPNVGNTYTSYVQDSWRLSDLWEADYGMRYDFFTITSTDFEDGFGQFSPRFKLTRFWGRRAAMYVYIGRFFEPFSFENVDPRAAQLLNAPIQPTPGYFAPFDLKPERDTQLEAGGHLPFGKGELGLRVFQKNANDLIDDTEVGVTLLHQDINYTLGRISAETVDYNQPFARNGRAYVNVNHTDSVNSGCETQLLAPCFGSPTEYTPADHEQRWSITGGVLLNDTRGGWFSGDVEYGAGLSSAYCVPYTDDCKETPHTILAAEKGWAVGGDSAFFLRITNLLNDRYYVTLLNAQGNHFAPPREFEAGFRFGE